MRTAKCRTQNERICDGLLKLVAGTMVLNHVTISELSKMTGIERTGLGKMLKGEQQMYIHQFVAVCRALGIRMEELEKAV